MKAITATYFRTKFSEILEQVNNGEPIAITYGKRKEIVGYFVSQLPKRQLGILEGKAKVTFNDDFKITEQQFLNLSSSR